MRSKGRAILLITDIQKEKLPLFFRDLIMKKYLFILVVSLPILGFSQQEISIKLVDEDQNAIFGVGAQILNSYQYAVSDFEGKITFDNSKEENVQIAFTHIAFENDTLLISNTNSGEITVEMKSRTYHNEEVLIQATRIAQASPGAVSVLDKESIKEQNLGQDLPFILQNTPSLVSTSEAGAGIGYTGMRIRGTDATRINVTINGIPTNDAESQGLFWVNMPDLASSLNSIQIQRGLGTSTNGSAAFGASVNLETTTMEKEGYGAINSTFGSFNTRKNTVQFGSGIINDHFSFNGRLSQIQSDGYLDRSSADLKSYFLNGSYISGKTIIKALAFGGKERTQQAWWGTPQSRFENDLEGMKEHADNNYLSDADRKNLLESGRTYNYYTYEDQVDNYQQDHFQLHLSHEFSEKLTANLALHYTIGKGYYEEYKSGQDLSNYNFSPVVLPDTTINETDLIRRRWLDNDFYGLTYSFLYQASSKVDLTIGGGANQYDGDHFGEVIWAEYASNSRPSAKYYLNNGKKLDINNYIKTAIRPKKNLLIYADIQVRAIEYEVEGTDNDQRSLDVVQSFLFFNPKIGFNLQLNSSNTLYGLLALGNREPNRADLVDQTQGLVSTAINDPESMTNIEFGLERKRKNYQSTINLYYMGYTDQLVLTGEVNDVGGPIRQNVEKSYRAGIEFQNAFRIRKNLQFETNITLSQNKIKEFNELIYDFSGNAAYVGQKENSDISFSPNVIANTGLHYRIKKRLNFSFLSRYVGKQYLDNTSNENRKLDSYFVNDFRISYEAPIPGLKSVNIALQVNNLFSENYASNGYTYSYFFGNVVTENFVYPQAFRNFLLAINFKF